MHASTHFTVGASKRTLIIEDINVPTVDQMCLSRILKEFRAVEIDIARFIDFRKT